MRAFGSFGWRGGTRLERHTLSALAGRYSDGKERYTQVPRHVRDSLWRHSHGGKYFIWLMREWQRAALESSGEEEDGRVNLTQDEEVDLSHRLFDITDTWNEKKFPRDIYQLSAKQAKDTIRLRRRTRPVPLVGDETKLILDTPEFAVVRFESRDSACFYGRGTKWCIASETEHWWWSYRNDGWRTYLVLNKILPSEHPFYKVALLLRWRTREPPIVESTWTRADDRKTTEEEMTVSGFDAEDVKAINVAATRDFRGLGPARDVEVFETFKSLRTEVKSAQQDTPRVFEETFEQLRPMRDEFATQFAHAVSSISMEPLLPAFGEMFKSEEFWIVANADHRIWTTIAPHESAMLALANSVRAMRDSGDEYFLFLFGRGAFTWGWRSENSKTGLLALERTLPSMFDKAVNGRFETSEQSLQTGSAKYMTGARLQLVLFALHGYMLRRDKRNSGMESRFLEPDVRAGVDLVGRRIEASITDAKAQVQARLAKRELSEREEMEFLTPLQMSYFAHIGSYDIEHADMATARTRLALAWIRAHVPKPPADE